MSLGSLNGSNGFRLDGVAAYDFSGFSVAAAGDVNGDGVDDVVIGANYADPIAEALLSVTDEKVARSPNPVIAKTYAALRGQAKTHTAEAVPAVGKLLAGFLA